VVRCFDDAEIIHVEGDVDPIRDLDIISEELRIKDIEFVEKAHENLVKQTRRGGQSLEMKKMKEEQATVEKILAWLKDGKDVRKGDWSPKEVRFIALFLVEHYTLSMFYMMTKSVCSIIPALRMPHFISRRGYHEKTSLSELSFRLYLFHMRKMFVSYLTLPGRGHQPVVSPHRQASRLFGQPQREGLHPSKKQAFTQDRAVGEGAC